MKENKLPSLDKWNKSYKKEKFILYACGLTKNPQEYTEKIHTKIFELANEYGGPLPRSFSDIYEEIFNKTVDKRSALQKFFSNLMINDEIIEGEQEINKAFLEEAQRRGYGMAPCVKIISKGSEEDFYHSLHYFPGAVTIVGGKPYKI